ncbi:DNA polymerase III subunit delta [Agrobacterium sp. ES01]|uniref:DNA polymerase III subunit delta n=1 Tax=Agrobacterium sp. ES01 TaxID=3420714 RepID=UPI003D09A410
MTEIKSHEYDGFLKGSARSYRLFILYGPDRGLVSERAVQLAAVTGVPLDDPFALIRLDATDLQGDPGRLLDETGSIGLFGGEKLIWLRAGGTEKALTDAVDQLAKGTLEGSFVIIEAGDLKKGAALRRIGESSRICAQIACYQDDARSLNALIDSELGQTGQRITPAARDMLVSSLGGDRIASRNEINKLLLYCLNLPQIDLEHVVEIIGDASAISVDEAVDAVLKGDREGFLHATNKIVSSKTPVFLLLQACLRQFQQLDVMKTEMEDKRLQAGQAMQTLGRGIHFKRKPVVERALRNWTSTDLAKETSRMLSAILLCRQRPQLEDDIAMQTLLSTTLQSARRNR